VIAQAIATSCDDGTVAQTTEAHALQAGKIASGASQPAASRRRATTSSWSMSSGRVRTPGNGTGDHSYRRLERQVVNSCRPDPQRSYEANSRAIRPRRDAQRSTTTWCADHGLARLSGLAGSCLADAALDRFSARGRV
jgi:hypothetical protein